MRGASFFKNYSFLRGAVGKSDNKCQGMAEGGLTGFSNCSKHLLLEFCRAVPTNLKKSMYVVNELPLLSDYRKFANN